MNGGRLCGKRWIHIWNCCDIIGSCISTPLRPNYTDSIIIFLVLALNVMNWGNFGLLCTGVGEISQRGELWNRWIPSKKGSFVLHSLSRTTTVFLQNVLTKKKAVWRQPNVLKRFQTHHRPQWMHISPSRISLLWILWSLRPEMPDIEAAFWKNYMEVAMF